jgi:hypothetical protein
MNGQPEALLEQAVLQARREADLLYLLAVNANIAVLESRVQGEREYIFLLGYLMAEVRGHLAKDQVENLRLAFLMFIESVIGVEAAIAQLVAEWLHGQPVLFRDTAVKLAELLKMATNLSTWFNMLAVEVGAEIDLERLRNDLQSEIDHQVSAWVSGARVKMLALFGTIEEMHAAMDHALLFFEPKSGERTPSPRNRSVRTDS